jgi:hypothetical protein
LARAQGIELFPTDAGTAVAARGVLRPNVERFAVELWLPGRPPRPVARLSEAIAMLGVGAAPSVALLRAEQNAALRGEAAAARIASVAVRAMRSPEAMVRRLAHPSVAGWRRSAAVACRR